VSKPAGVPEQCESALDNREAEGGCQEEWVNNRETIDTH